MCENSRPKLCIERRTLSMNILFIDNFDSFTYNLVQYFLALHTTVRVIRNNVTNYQDLLTWADKVVISPGPKSPKDAGISKQIIAACKGKIPLLGVCLGMQAINEVYGGQTTHAPIPIHGKVSRIFHTGNGLFINLPESFNVARYHSLIAGPLGDISIDAWTQDNIPMAISNEKHLVYGVQFHPESFLSEHGVSILRNFINLHEGCVTTKYESQRRWGKP